MNIDRLHSLYKTFSRDLDPCFYTEKDLSDLSPFLSNPDVQDYLKYCLFPRKTSGSVFELLTLPYIKLRTLEETPGGDLCEYGYLTIGEDIGGNSLCLHAPTGSVWFVEHDYFYYPGEPFKVDLSQMDTFLEEDKDFLEMTENALVKLSDNIEEFLIALLKEEFDICQFIECVQDPLV